MEQMTSLAMNGVDNVLVTIAKAITELVPSTLKANLDEARSVPQVAIHCEGEQHWCQK